MIRPITCNRFESACASGSDWHECVQDLHAALKKAIDDKSLPAFNIGFVYVSDPFADHLHHILQELKALFNIQNWTGTVAMGVVGQNTLEDKAISIMVGSLPEKDFIFFDKDDCQKNVKITTWDETHRQSIAYMHGTPLCEGLREQITTLASKSKSFVTGGISTARYNFQTVNKGNLSLDYSGVIFSPNTLIATSISQGTRAFSPTYTVTKCDDSAILEIDHKPATDFLTEVLRENHRDETGYTHNTYTVSFDDLESISFIPEEYSSLLHGRVHVGFSFPSGDLQNNFIREITNIDVQDKSLSTTQETEVGTSIYFAHRSEDTILQDFQERLDGMQKHITDEHGSFQPKAALLVSGLGRGKNLDKQLRKQELEILKSAIGNIPLTGFYASGEIYNAQIYNLCSTVLLFL